MELKAATLGLVGFVALGLGSAPALAQDNATGMDTTTTTIVPADDNDDDGGKWGLLGLLGLAGLLGLKRRDRDDDHRRTTTGTTRP